jgi:hypothetical protein
MCTIFGRETAYFLGLFEGVVHTNTAAR